MSLPIIDWQFEFLELELKFRQLESQTLRLETKIIYLQEENQALKSRLAEYERTKIGTCLECGGTFEEKATGRKKRFCANACKQTYYRTRKSFARLLNET